VISNLCFACQEPEDDTSVL